MSTFDRRLTQCLRKSGGVDEEIVTQALAVAHEKQTPLFDTLVEMGTLTEKELIGLVAMESGAVPIDLDQLSVEHELCDVVTKELAVRHNVLPVSKIGSVLTLAVDDPFDVIELDHLQLKLSCEIRMVVASSRALKEGIRNTYNRDAATIESLLGDARNAGDELTLKEDTTDDDDIDLSDLGSETSPVVKMTNLIIANAIRDGASDIHIEPFETQIRVRYRQDGILKDVPSPPRALGSPIVSRIKIMSSLDIAEKRKPQDGKFQVKIEGRSVDFRVSTLPVVHGEKVVMRILDNSNLAKGLDTLGFEQKCLDDFREAIKAPYGMILITGPTGSGKSTTLYSSVKELYSDEINFVTVEDPVEYQLDGINQVPVNPKRGVTFAAALRAILRQDPDTILIGEIRDAETIEIGVKAALTGHLVLSTLHTNDAPGAISRMIDMGVDPFLVATSVVLVAAQRLCRRLCASCAAPAEFPAERLTAIGFTEEEAASTDLLKAVGCGRCHQGYKGRFAIIETLKMTDGLKRLILEGKSAIDLKRQGLEEGMVTLRRSAILNTLRGKTTVEEVLRVTMSDDF